MMRRRLLLALVAAFPFTLAAQDVAKPDPKPRADQKAAPAGKMKKPVIIAVEGAPKAAGPYSQGVVANGFLYTAGQVPRDPVTLKVVEGDITVQTQRVFDNLEAVLKGAGCGFGDVVKATVFLSDLADFEEMNKVFAARFGDHKPARTTVQAAKIPGGARLEIDLIAAVP